MAINLQELESRLDKALELETSESLIEWLDKQREFMDITTFLEFCDRDRYLAEFCRDGFGYNVSITENNGFGDGIITVTRDSFQESVSEIVRLLRPHGYFQGDSKQKRRNK